MVDKLKYFLRWLIVLPGAIIAAFVATFPLHWLLYIAYAKDGTLLGIIELPPGSNLTIEYLFYPFVMAIVFVWSGYKLAPKHKLKAATALFAIYAITWLVVSLLSLTSGNVGNISANFGARTILALIGAVLGLYIAKTENKEALPK